MPLYIRFEHCLEDRCSQDFGPFEFVQLTYTELRVGTNGERFSSFSRDNLWDAPGDKREWSDVVIFDKP